MSSFSTRYAVPLTLAWASVTLASVCRGQLLPPEKPAAVSNSAPITLTPAQAVKLAADDCAALADTKAQLFARYVQFTVPAPLDQAGFVYSLNTGASRSENIYRSVPLHGGFLHRIDLRKLAATEADLRLLVTLWETRIGPSEPYFHRADLLFKESPSPSPARSDSLAAYLSGIPQISFFQRRNVAPYKANGVTYSHQAIPLQRHEQFSLHTNLDSMLLLHGLTDSNAPIVRAEWLQNVMLSTLRVGRTLGLYYEFQGVKSLGNRPLTGNLKLDSDEARGVKRLNQNQVLTLFGSEPDAFSSLTGEARAAINHSKITDRARSGEIAFGRKVRPTKGTPWLTITHDISINDVDPFADPILNLVQSVDTAREAIFVLPNGMLAGFLFNNAGILQDFVPDTIAHDSTIPSPSPQTLQPVLSCLTCHLPENGYKKFPNDVRTLYLSRLNVTPNNPDAPLLPSDLRFEKADIFSDAQFLKSLQTKDPHATAFNNEELLQFLFSRYGGDLELSLNSARLSHAVAASEISNFTLPQIGASLTETRNRFVFGRIDAVRACLEIGYPVPPDYAPAFLLPEKYAAHWLSQIVPTLDYNSLNFSPEHAHIRTLKAGLDLSRAQFESIYPDLASRAFITAKAASIYRVPEFRP